MAEIGQSQRNLWYHRGFLLLWGGQTISQLGSQVTTWALPLTAVFLLKATAGQMGLLVAVRNVSYLLVGLFAGAWVDRVRRRPLLIVTDIGRAVLLGTIPITALFGYLSMLQLYIVTFFTGLLAVLFDVAYLSFLPSLVSLDQLIEGNGKLEASVAAAGIAGPGLAGALVQLFTGPIAILADALSFVVSALSLTFIRVKELPPLIEERQSIWLEIREGLHTVIHYPILRTLAIGSGLFNFFDSILLTVYVLYLTKTIGATPLLIGIIIAISSSGGLLGALFAARVTHILGLGPALLGGVLLASVADCIIASASGPLLAAVLLVIVGEGSVQAGAVLYSINGVSLRQAIVPNRLRGRVNSVIRIISLGVVPLGALLGGFLGDRYGLRTTVFIAGGGTFLAFLWVLFSPVRQLRKQPSGNEA
ncbi:MAG: MFS transporter [Ktedonobacteraceae bacterium]